jgi:hypothetical protein
VSSLSIELNSKQRLGKRRGDSIRRDKAEERLPMLVLGSGRVMEPVDAPEVLDEMDEWDAIEDLQNQLEELEKKYRQLRTSLWAAFGSLVALLVIFRG